MLPEREDRQDESLRSQNDLGPRTRTEYVPPAEQKIVDDNSALLTGIADASAASPRGSSAAGRISPGWTKNSTAAREERLGGFVEA